MNENLASLIAGFGLCYSGGAILSTHLKSVTTARFRDLIHRSARNPWSAAGWGFLFNIVIGRASILALIITGLLSAGMMTVAQALPMVVWGNVGGVLIIYLAVIDLKLLALFAIGISGIAYGFGGKSRLRNLFGSFLGIGMLILGVVLVKESAEGAYDLDWLRGLFDMVAGRLWVAFLLGWLLKLLTQSGLVLALLEISLLQAGIIGLPEVIAIFLGSRMATSVNAWLFSAALRGPGKQLMMIQVSYNLIGSVVFMLLLYVEYWTSMPAIERLLEGISSDSSMQVATLALLYCVATSLAVTLLRVPLLAFIQRRWAYQEHDDPFEPRYINELALASPETAMDLMDREQVDLLRRTQQYLGLIVGGEADPAAVKAGRKDLQHGHEAFRVVAKKVNVFLVDLGNRSLSNDSFGRFLGQQNRQGMLISLENQVYEFSASPAHGSGQGEGSGHLGEVIGRFRESMDFILSTAVDTLESRDPLDVHTLESITADRGATMERLRELYLADDSRLSSADKNTLLDATRYFERGVWLVHLLVQSLSEGAEEDGEGITQTSA